MSPDAPPTRESLAARDAADPLGPCRDQFSMPEGVIYLDGNSLGALPRATARRLSAVVEDEWGRDLIGSWNSHDWIGLPRRIGDRITPLIGASPGEVVAADSTSVNVFKLLAGAVGMRPDRTVILTEEGNFPTDLYMAQGLIGLACGGLSLRALPSDAFAEPEKAITDDVAVVMLTHVDYRSGAMHEMARITRAAQAAGALMLWDLSHSAGAVPVDLNGAGADLAVGCGYKYLNGGPGAPAFLFVAARHQDAFRQPLSGWMGHARPFAFEPGYDPAEGITRNLCGTPSVLALAALEAGLETFDGVTMDALRTKSLALTDLFIDLVEARCPGFGLATPGGHEARGSQVCLTHPEGYAIVQALIARGVIGDFRVPDILRFGFAPLYLRFVDIWDAVEHLRDIMESRAWDDDAYRVRAAVT